MTRLVLDIAAWLRGRRGIADGESWEMGAYGRRCSPSKSSWRSALSRGAHAARRGLALLLVGLVVYPATEAIRWRNRHRSWR